MGLVGIRVSVLQCAEVAVDLGERIGLQVGLVRIACALFSRSKRYQGEGSCCD